MPDVLPMPDPMTQAEQQPAAPAPTPVQPSDNDLMAQEDEESLPVAQQNEDELKRQAEQEELLRKQQEEEAAKAAAAREYATKKGIVLEETEDEGHKALSGIPERPYCKGRNYDPNRYNNTEE